MSQFFLFFYQIFAGKKRLFWLLLVALLGALGWMASRLSFEENMSRMIPKGINVGNAQEMLDNSKALDKILVNVQLQDTAAGTGLLMEYADSLMVRLQSDSLAQSRIITLKAKLPDDLLQQSYGFFQRHLPLFLEEEDYKAIEAKTHPSHLKGTLENGLKWMSLPSSGAFRQYFLSDPLFFTPIALGKLSQLQMDDRYHLEEGYLTSKDGKSLLLIIQPKFPSSNIKENTILVEQLDQAIASLQTQFRHRVKVEYFGGPAVAVCNSKQIKKDVYLTSILSLLLISLTIWAYYRRLSVAVVLFVPVFFGLLFAAAAMWWIKGEISIMSLASGAIVLGIIIDYSTHFFSHLKHTGSITQTIKDISLPMVIGNVSTVGAFASLVFLDSAVLNDFGLFSALSLMGGALFTLLILPQLTSNPGKTEDTWFAKCLGRIGRYQPEKNKWLVRFALLFTIACFFLYDKVEFEENLNSLNYLTEDLRVAEEHLFAKQAESERNMMILFTGPSLDAAIANASEGTLEIKKLQKEGKIGSVSNPTLLLPSLQQQQTRIERWENFWTKERKGNLSKELESVAKSLGIKAHTFQSFFESIEAKQTPFSPEEDEFLRHSFLDDLVSDGEKGSSVLLQLKVPHEQALHVNERLSSLSNVAILDKQLMATKLSIVVRDNFNQLLAMSSLLVFAILLLSYGRIELALFTFIPMLISWIWILAIMALLGFKFNIVNIIISTFIFGLGDDFSIFIMDGLQKKYAQGKNDLDSFKTAIFLSMLTTLLGIGVLIVAKHPALHSVALISIIGVLTTMGIAFLFIPLLFQWFVTNRTARKLPPLTLLGLLRSAFAFVYYLTGCILLTLIGIILFKVLRLEKSERVKYFYHCLFQFTTWSLVRIMFIVKVRIKKKADEKFQKPAIIVANHQSFLDILVILMLHPKLIFFTNNWVWNSPFFGKMVQMADFYAVESGVENSLDMVKKKVDQGYSIVIFPEGTRSVDGTIKRFHKGAFFLAEKLQVDVLPIVLHGTGHCMSKNDFLLSKGILTVHILDRTPPSKGAYQEKAKEVAKLIRSEYQKLNTPHFFHYRLMQNYILKGPVLEWYTRIKVALEKDYVLFDEHLPKHGLIYDLGCGYGYMSHILSWTAPNRQFIGVDYDEEKIATAQHVIQYTDNAARFFQGDVVEFPLEPCKAIILADVLHYLGKEKQLTLLDRCLHALEPGGIFLLRDGDIDSDKDHARTKWTEIFSTQLVGFNKTSTAKLEFVSLSEIRTYIQSKQHFEVETIEKSAITSNTVLKITKHSLLN